MKRTLVSAVIAALLSGIPVVPALAQTSATTTAPAPTLDQRLIDTAGHFETITEQAYTKTKDELLALLMKGETAVASVSGNLSADGKAALDAAVKDLRAALAEGTPSRIAVSSVEAYRALVNEVSTAHPVPKQVSLLDYAGFKVQALAQDGTIDWAEIGRTLDFADTTWNEIAARITDTTLRDQFADSLIGLRNAAQAQDKDRLLQAATVELDLVDSLEGYFAKK